MWMLLRYVKEIYWYRTQHRHNGIHVSFDAVAGLNNVIYRKVHRSLVIKFKKKIFWLILSLRFFCNLRQLFTLRNYMILRLTSN